MIATMTAARVGFAIMTSIIESGVNATQFVVMRTRTAAKLKRVATTIFVKNSIYCEV